MIIVPFKTFIILAPLVISGAAIKKNNAENISVLKKHVSLIFRVYAFRLNTIFHSLKSISQACFSEYFYHKNTIISF